MVSDGHMECHILSKVVSHPVPPSYILNLDNPKHNIYIPSRNKWKDLIFLKLCAYRKFSDQTLCDVLAHASLRGN